MIAKLRDWVYLFLTVLVVALVALPAHAALDGNFEQGRYTAPGELFTVKSPLGPQPILVDSFDRTTGAVTFFDESGQLFGVICTPNFDVLASADNDFETNAAILRNWFHEATFPLFFERQLPGASILREEPGEFEGVPAWIAVMHLPRGSSMIRIDPATGYPARQDSWRGIVVFSRGEHTYLIMTEAILDPTGLDRPQFNAATPDWNFFLGRLAQFYRGITFPALAPVTPEEKTQPAEQQAGT